jgi:hypothetical protein
MFSPSLWFRKWKPKHKPRHQTRPRILCLEALEDRITPASFGFPWPDAQHLTLSFVPDGTVVGNSTSQLSATATAAGYTATAWEMEILRAFQTWAVQTQVSISVVNDTGMPLGTPGLLEGDPRFGDIRIAFVPGSTEVATAVPFDATAGTWSGDVIFNSSDTFAINPPPGSASPTSPNPPIYDLYSVALHEAGHALGVAGNTTDQFSAMFEFYNRDQRTGTNGLNTTTDIPAIQSLYGPPSSVEIQDDPPNHSLATAEDFLEEGLEEFAAHALHPGTTPNEGSLTPLTVDSTLLSPGDVDYFRYQTTFDAPNFVVSLQTSGISLLNARLTLLDAVGNPVPSTVTTDPATGVSIRPAYAYPGAFYYFKVESTNPDVQNVFGIGNFRLAVTPDAFPTPLTLDRFFSFFPGGELHDHGTLATAMPLAGATTQTNDRFDFIHYGNLGVAADVDYYRFQSPSSGTALQSMTVMVWGRDTYAPVPNGLLPSVTVYDALGNVVVPDMVQQNSNGTEIVRINNAHSNATYFVSVQANATGSPTGRYFVGIDFSTRNQADQTFVGSVGTLNDPHSPQQQQVDHGVRVTPSTGFHALHLDVTATKLSPTTVGVTTAIEFSVIDVNHNVVYDSGRVLAGQTVSATLFLAPGDYDLRVVGGSSNNSNQGRISYTVQGTGLTDPIDPQLINPGSPPATPPPFLWSFDPLFRDFLALINPYGNPILPGGGPGT